ncbi:MAG TPA: hypothetical protein VH593_13995 [Ktedonobacteraceae bacterium]
MSDDSIDGQEIAPTQPAQSNSHETTTNPAAAQQPIEPIPPTQPAPHNFYNPYEINPYWDISGPPPPPKQKRIWLFALFISISCLAIFSGVAFSVIYLNNQQDKTATKSMPTHTALPTATIMKPSPTLDPTINTNYTASSIVSHMQAMDKTVAIESTNETIWAFSHDNYYISVHATSSVQFTGCPIGDCAEIWVFGLWVYANSQGAESAYNQVYNDSLSCTDTSSRADGMYVICGAPEQEYAHGRCLLLSAVATSIYGQIVTQYCV